MTAHTIEFADAAAAHKFLFENRSVFVEPETRRRLADYRWPNKDGLHRCRISDATALRWAANLLARQPRLAKKLKAKTLKPTQCQRCGCGLSDPESIAAGFGPECMEKMVG